MKVCVFPFPNKGNNGISKKYIRITLTNLAANIKTASFLYRIRLEIQKIVALFERTTTSQNLKLLQKLFE